MNKVVGVLALKREDSWDVAVMKNVAADRKDRARTRLKMQVIRRRGSAFGTVVNDEGVGQRLREFEKGAELS